MKELHFFTWQDQNLLKVGETRKDLPSPISLMVFVHFLDGLQDFNSSHQLLTKHQV